jgi:hypothetical protein
VLPVFIVVSMAEKGARAHRWPIFLGMGITFGATIPIILLFMRREPEPPEEEAEILAFAIRKA